MAGVNQMVNFITRAQETPVPADFKTLMWVFSLPPLEAKFLALMLGGEGWIGKEELPEGKYSTRQTIHKLRARMDPLRIWVINDNRGRYSIPPSSRLVAKQLIEQALTLGVKHAG